MARGSLISLSTCSLSLETSTRSCCPSDGFPDPLPTLDESETRLQEHLEIDPAAVAELWSVGKALRPGANSVDDRAYLARRYGRCDMGSGSSEIAGWSGVLRCDRVVIGAEGCVKGCR